MLLGNSTRCDNMDTAEFRHVARHLVVQEVPLVASVQVLGPVPEELAVERQALEQVVQKVLLVVSAQVLEPEPEGQAVERQALVPVVQVVLLVV